MTDNSQAEFTHYFRANRPEMAQFVPDGVTRALDVGCASGGFGSELKAKGIEVWGIEPNSTAAGEASAQLDKVLVGTFHDVAPDLPNGHFDLITFNDVLEHIADCDQVLRDVRQLLTPGGHVLVSLPNVRYWLALMTIFWQRDFPYQDEGVFDRTHLRFFTHKSMMRMFEECGYEVVLCKGINGRNEGKLPIVNFLTRGRFWDSEFLQFAILARPRQ